MNEKKVKLIESGMRLFTLKGYHKTSVQEIATEAGISKGGFYLYFQSKEEFLTTATDFLHKQISRHVEQLSTEELMPREVLANQITAMATYIHERRDFIMVYFQEDISMGPKGEELFERMKNESFQWLKGNVQAIYGEKVERYLFDIIIQLEGLMNGYYQRIVTNDLHIDKSRVGGYLVKRLDTLVDGLLAEDEEPLVSSKEGSNLRNLCVSKQSKEEQVETIMKSMRKKIMELQLAIDEKDKLFTIVDLILAKHDKGTNERLLIKGMLALIEPIPELKVECEELAILLDLN